MWFLDNPARLQTERRAIEDLTAEAAWLAKTEWGIIDSQLSLNADIRAHGHIYSIRMTYPAHFPLSPPSVRPSGDDQRWSQHQYGTGGDLCLEWGPDNWLESVTGADMIRSTHRLLDIEDPMREDSVSLPPAPSRHTLMLGQEMRGSPLRFIVQSSTAAFFKTLAATGFANFHLLISRESATVFVKSLQLIDSEEWLNVLLPEELEKTTFQCKGVILKTALTEQDLSALDTVELRKALEREGHDLTRIEPAEIRYLLIIDLNGGAHLFSCLDSAKLYAYQTLNVSDVNLGSRLGPDLATINSKRVGIIGLGSAGSKIGTSLARAGVRDFLLIDYDIFLPENICRHELTWEDVGQHKVDAMTHLLKLIDPGMQIRSRKLMLTGQEASSNVSSSLSQLADCTIIIDATANSDVFNMLSALACQTNRAYIWFEIFEGGIGGLLCRFRPGIEPDPKLIRQMILDYLERKGQPSLQSAGDYSAISGSGRIFVACDADVSIIAGYVTQMALDLLAEHEPSAFPYSVYLIGFQRSWIFQEPFHTIPLDIPAIKTETGQATMSDEDLEDNIQFLKGLIHKLDQ